MIRWLGSDQAPRPELIDSAPDDDSDASFIESNIETGSVVLARGDRRITLAWKKGDDSRRRALPAGSYRLRTTRVERVDKDGTRWFVSLSGPGGRKLRIATGKTNRLVIDTAVHFKGKVKRRGHRLQLAMAITGANGRGLSIYKNGKRVAVDYKLLDAKGRVLARGRMNYG